MLEDEWRFTRLTGAKIEFQSWIPSLQKSKTVKFHSEISKRHDTWLQLFFSVNGENTDVLTFEKFCTTKLETRKKKNFTIF